MIKKMTFRKILITSIGLFAVFLIYMMPNEQELLNVPYEVEYVNSDINKSEIYLLDDYNMLARTMVATDTNLENKAKELLEVLIEGGSGENKIPNGFKSIIPSDTKLKSLTFKEGLIKVDFSKELLDVSLELEEKIIEAIVHTLTSIEEVKKVVIYVEGEVLTKLPKSKINLPTTLDKNFGINKEYDFTNSKDINQVTIYYINKSNNDLYYVPVTKYVNDTREKAKIIIDELAGSNSYNTNLMSYLNSNTDLLSVESKDSSLELNFNSYIFNDLDTKNILEEVMYTINLSMGHNYDIEEVIYKVDNEEIYKSVLKTIE